MRRTPMMVGAVAAAAMMLAACSQGSQTASSDESTLDYIGDEAAVLPQLEAAAGATEEATGLQFAPRTVQSTENYQQVIRSSLTSASAPDLLKWWNGFRLQDLARSDGLLDITAQWDEAVANGWLDDSTRDAFSYDGSVYAMPFDANYWVVYYNKEIYADLGLEVPTTWQPTRSPRRTSLHSSPRSTAGGPRSSGSRSCSARPTRSSTPTWSAGMRSTPTPRSAR